jgi:hypothetical protein
MGKKIVTLAIISFLLISGLVSFPAIGIKTSKLNTSTQDKINKISINQEYPDLIPKLISEIEFDWLFGLPNYHWYVEVHNIGEKSAHFPEGSILATVASYFPTSKVYVETNHRTKEDLLLLPGQIFRDYAGEGPFFLSQGAEFTVTADPQDLIYEGEEGEKNNILELIIFSYNSKISLIQDLKQIINYKY